MKMPIPSASVAASVARCTDRAVRPVRAASVVAVAAAVVALVGVPSAARAQGEAGGVALSGEDPGAGAPVAHLPIGRARRQRHVRRPAARRRAGGPDPQLRGVHGPRRDRGRAPAARLLGAQAQAFEERRRAREQEEREAQQARILAAERERLVQVPTRIYSRGPNFFNGPSVPMSMVSPTYSSSPGVPGGNGAGFIGSGFATAR